MHFSAELSETLRHRCTVRAPNQWPSFRDLPLNTTPFWVRSDITYNQNSKNFKLTILYHNSSSNSALFIIIIILQIVKLLCLHRATEKHYQRI